MEADFHIGQRQSQETADRLHRPALCPRVRGVSFRSLEHHAQSYCSWDYSTSIPELMQALDALVKQNKVLYLGISDTPGQPSDCLARLRLIHASKPQ